MTGMDRIDVGRCPPGKCYREWDGKDTCMTERHFCCGPIRVLHIEINCSDENEAIFPVTYDVITRCGCTEFENVKTYILGKVIMRATQEPIAEALIFRNGHRIAHTDINGQFNVSMFEDATKAFNITLEARAPRHLNLMDATETVEFDYLYPSVNWWLTIQMETKTNLN